MMNVWICAGLVCAVLGAVVYLDTLDCGFCFDDDAAVENNDDLRPNTSWANLLWNDFWGLSISHKDSHKSYRPLCVATFRLNYMLHGLEPMGYHLVNVLLHAVVCYLYVQLCAVVFTKAWPALVAGLLFAVHPIHTEAVAGLVGRADILAALLFISAILLYRRALLEERTSPLISLSLIFCLGSALCKEIGITSVALCLSYEFFIHMQMDLPASLSLLNGLWKGRLWSSRLMPFVKRVFLFVLCTLTFLVFRFKLNQGPPIFSVHNNPALGFETPYRQLHWAYLIFYNLQLLFLPSGLMAEYPMGTIPPISSLLDYRNIVTLATFATLFFFSWKSVTCCDLYTRKPLVFGLALMIFPFLPASNLFFPVGFVVAERVLYIPSMGFCILVALGFWKLKQSCPFIVKVGIAYLLVVHSTKTCVRNRDWYSSIDLFQSAVTVAPNNGKMFNNLASQIDLAGNKTLAVQLFRQSIRVEPYFITAYGNLAYCLRGLGNMSEATKVYQQAADLVTRGLGTNETIHVTPKNVKMYNSLSNMLREHSNDGAGALYYANKAIEVEPDWENGYHSKANALVHLGKLQEAKQEFEKALSINPQFMKARSNYGDCLEKIGQFEQAEEQYRKALRIEPTSILVKFRLAGLIVKYKSATTQLLLEAEQLLKDVLVVEPANGNATFTLGLVFYDLKRYVEAEQLFQQVLQISPNDKGALYNLGVLLTAQERYGEAIDYLQQLLTHHPDHDSGPSQLATCYMQSNQTSLARETFELVLQRTPNNAMAIQNYGLLCIREKDYEKALELFTQLLQLQPDNLPVQQQIKQLQKATRKQI